MIRRAALHALSRAVADADETAVTAALSGDNPAVRWLAARRARRALRRAWLSVVPRGADAVEDTLHGLHVAWLMAAGVPHDHALTDPTIAKETYYAQRDARSSATGTGRRGRWITPSVGALAVGLGVVVALGLGGGAPDPRSGPLGQALTDHLTSWVVVLDRWGPVAAGDGTDMRLGGLTDELDAVEARVLAGPVADALGAAAHTALGQVLTRTRELVATQQVDPVGMKVPVDRFREALRVANRAFAEARVPYFLDGDWMIRSGGHLQAGLFVFSVIARNRVDAGLDAPIEAVHLRRIDRLNWVRSLLGYTRKTMDEAVILRGKVEDQLVTYVGPALANNAAMPLLDRDDRARTSEWARIIQAEAGRVARATVEEALPDDLTALRDFGALLAERADRFAGFRRNLEARGLRLSVPGSLELSDALLESLEDGLPDFQVKELRDIQRRLTSGDNTALFARLLARFAQSVEGHEVQHRIDYTRGDAFPVPDLLRANMGLELAEGDDPDAALPASLARANYELSAYLSEIAREPELARLDLILVARHVIGGGGGAEWQAAVAILDGLAEELGLLARTSRGNTVSRRLASETLMALVRHDRDALVAAAKALWERWYGQPLAPLRRLPPAS